MNCCKKCKKMLSVGCICGKHQPREDIATCALPACECHSPNNQKEEWEVLADKYDLSLDNENFDDLQKAFAEVRSTERKRLVEKCEELRDNLPRDAFSRRAYDDIIRIIQEG